MTNIFRKVWNFFRGFDEESVCVADKLIDIIRDVNKAAFRAELQKETQIYCRDLYGDRGIDITPDILFRNRRRATRFVRRYGNRHSRSHTKSESFKTGGSRKKKSKQSSC